MNGVSPLTSVFPHPEAEIMRTFTRVRLLAVTALLSAIVVSPCSTAALAGKPRPAVVRVKVPEKDDLVSYGSGTLVGISDEHGVVLTNWHVVRDAAGEIVVHFRGGFRSTATVLETDETWDLAALLIRPPKVEPVAISEKTPDHGQLLTIAGFGGGTYREASGKVTQYVSPGEDEPSEMVEVEVPARPGDSGGPIFNRHGQIAGVLFGSADGCTNGSHSERLRWFLRRALAKQPKLAAAIFRR